MSKENLDHFEIQIKDLMEQYEAPYEPEGWDRIEQELNKSSAPKKTSNTLKVSVIAASIALAVVGGYYAFFNEENKTSTENEKQVTHRSVEEKDTQEKEPSEKEKPFTSKDQKESEDQTSEGSTPADDTHKETSNVTAEEDKGPKEETVGSNEHSPEKEGDQEISEQTEKTETEPHTTSDEGKVRFQATFIANKVKGCPGENFVFRPTGIDKANKDQLNFFWEFGDGRSSEKIAPSHLYEESGSYDVSLTITNENGKTRKRNQHSLIRIYPEPNGKINERVTDQGIYRPVQFEVDAENKVQEVKWNFGDNSEPQIGHSVEHRYECAGNYPINATLSNEYGCSNSLEKEVSIRQRTYNLLAPTGFSPNNDGRNETFMPVALKNLDNEFHMTIYDPATGREVFETTSNSHPWDGTIAESGKKAEVGKTFIWRVVLYNNCGQSETYQNTIEVAKR